ncbi:MAG: Cell division protein FtsK [uncultured Thiotrichaceae bacterium]|uniref:DNA translocase FtsK n=1 Tax=uncultured Thiotrichaceae bacterium TaxID=298394 RepID=A0A6S6UL37_9GAMM|nr:MAG: Cell division protein FtsK [uncultured Thiotrichaceae bacterium]
MSLQQTSVLFFSGIAAIIFLALLTYSRTDCGFFRYDSECTHFNKAGGIGGYLAEFLFSMFGYLAYIIPLGLIVVGIILFRFPHKKNPNNPRGGINAYLSIAGAFIALIAGTGLAMQFWPDADLPYRGGGLLGLGVIKVVRSFFGDFGSIIVLFPMFLAGVTLFADLNWGQIIESIGDKVMNLFEMLVKTNEPVQAIEQGELKKGRAKQAVDTQSNKSHRMLPSLPSLPSLTGLGATAAGTWGWLKNRSLEAVSPPNIADDLDTDIEQTKKRSEVVLEPPKEKKLSIHPEIGNNGHAQPLTIPERPRKKSDSHEYSSPLQRIVSLPGADILTPAHETEGQYDPEALDLLSENIVIVLANYGVKEAVVTEYHPGPVITRFEIQLGDGTKVSKVSGLVKDLARNLGVHSVRIVEVIPGKTTIGLEVPNEKRDMVMMRSMVESNVFHESPSALTMALGKDISGIPVVADLGKMPHLLVAGTTGAGKSVAVNAMIISMLYKATAEEVRMIMIDPKMLELSIYDDIPHLLTPVVTDMKDAANALRWCVAEMERRYLLMSKLKVRNVAGFNQKVKDAIERGDPIIDPLFDATKSLEVRPNTLKPLPQIVIVVDEFADMMMIVGKKVEELIARLAQKARAAGIHLILATQRPSVDVITGLIKANIPTRIAFNVSTRVDSRTILDQGGAEQLLGQGDMLYLPPGQAIPKRIHGAFVSDEEVEDVVNYVKLQGEPEYIEDVLQEATSDTAAIPGLEPIDSKKSESDPLYDEAVGIVTESRRASISYLQRRLKVGYNRAATMIEDMEQAGVVSAVQSNGTREVIAPPPVTD